MSRIGRKEILLPEDVTLNQRDGIVIASGPKGTLEFKIKPGVEIKVSERKIMVLRKKQDKPSGALQGTVRQVIANMVVGVSGGWSKTMEVVGTGYRPNLEGEKLVLSLGFSHKIEVLPPNGINFSVSENKITISGIDKALVGVIAASIRRFRPPDAYKGKGIRYQGEKLKLKPGKAAKVGAGTPGAKS